MTQLILRTSLKPKQTVKVKLKETRKEVHFKQMVKQKMKGKKRTLKRHVFSKTNQKKYKLNKG